MSKKTQYYSVKERRRSFETHTLRLSEPILIRFGRFLTRKTFFLTTTKYICNFHFNFVPGFKQTRGKWEAEPNCSNRRHSFVIHGISRFICHSSLQPFRICFLPLNRNENHCCFSHTTCTAFNLSLLHLSQSQDQCII